jgi:Cys-rich protein (TIGR01571 family)
VQSVMKPAPPPQWVNKMEELERVEKKKVEADDRPRWETGICACFMDPVTCAIGAVAPCVLFGATVCLAGGWDGRRRVGERASVRVAGARQGGRALTQGSARGVAGMSKQLLGEEPAANGIGFCLVGIPFAAACFFREQIRVQYNIGGHSIVDGLCSVFCLPCSLCQIHRQLLKKPVRGANCACCTSALSSAAQRVQCGEQQLRRGGARAWRSQQ